MYLMKTWFVDEPKVGSKKTNKPTKTDFSDRRVEESEKRQKRRNKMRMKVNRRILSENFGRTLDLEASNS